MSKFEAELVTQQSRMVILAAARTEFMELCHKNHVAPYAPVTVTNDHSGQEKTDLAAEKPQNGDCSIAIALNFRELRTCVSFWYWGSRF